MSMRKGQMAPRTMTGGLRVKAWWVLRKKRHVTLSELLLTICDGSEKSAETNLRGWLNKLVTAGLLERERVADGKLTSNGSYLYRLVKDIGPKAPVVRASVSKIFDPNNGKTTSYLHRKPS